MFVGKKTKITFLLSFLVVSIAFAQGPPPPPPPPGLPVVPAIWALFVAAVGYGVYKLKK